MVRLAVSSTDSPPLSTTPQSNITSGSNNNSSYVHQSDTQSVIGQSTSPTILPSLSPTQQSGHQMTQNLPPQAIPLNQIQSHHMASPYHHHHSNSSTPGVNGSHIHDHNNSHHHNGLYLGPGYGNEFYPGADGPPPPPHGATYFIPPDMCPAHTQLCAVHPEFGKQHSLNS